MVAPVSEATAAHADQVLRLQALAVAAGRRAWRRVDPDRISESWTEALWSLGPVMAATQERAAVAGSLYGAGALAEQGTYRAPEAFVRPAGFAGVAPDGRDLTSLLYSPATTAKQLIAGGAAPVAALSSARGALDRIVQSVVADTARQAASVDVAARPGVGYIRMLVGKSCPDCVILAGRFYRWNAGFMRHPHDDCVHVPATQAAAPGMVTDPYEHFRAMTTAEQDAFWGPGSAQAIRDGADIYRVGNARRRVKGMTTLEGTSRRGYAADLRGRRLTPDGIYAQATSREEALRLLERHGYVLPGGQTPGGVIRGADYEGFGQMGRGGTRIGASAEVLRARATGVRDPGAVATMTAAERRVFDATTRWDMVRQGRNPYSRDGSGLTPDIAAKVETSYRRWVTSGGQVFTS